jgi:hypothetical protein
MAYSDYLPEDSQWCDPKERMRWQVDLATEEARVKFVPLHCNRWMLWVDGQGVALTIYFNSQQADQIVKDVELCLPPPEPRIVYVAEKQSRKPKNPLRRVPYRECGTAQKRKQKALAAVRAAK